MELLIVSFLAGVLTVAAPCILPLLPVIVGGTLTDDNSKNKYLTPLQITVSLAVSVVLFGLLLKASTTLIGVPQELWQIVSGGIVLLFGISILLPELWDKIMVSTKLSNVGNNLMGKSYKQRGVYRNVLLGVSLGPVFSSCSPTYALIIAVILPVSFAQGLTYLIAYAIGLSSVLLLIAILGQRITNKLNLLSNPKGWFRKSIGVVFIVVGIAVIFGIDKNVQSYILENGIYDPIYKIEEGLRLN